LLGLADEEKAKLHTGTAGHHSCLVAEPASRRDNGRRVAVAVAASLVVAMAVGLGIAARVDDSPEPLLGSAALAATVAVPGVLGLLGLRHRPNLWLPAGWTAFPLALLSAVTFPVLVPAAVVFLWAWVKRPSTMDRPRVPAGVGAAAVLVLVAGAVASLFFTPDDPRSWTSGTTSGYSSDVITDGEALVSLAAAALAVVAGWTLATPTATRRRQAG
jgi:hypothetical protein